MKKIKRTFKHTIIDEVRIVVDIGRSYWFEPQKMSGFMLTEWKERNIEEIEEFIKSIDPSLWDKKNHKKLKPKKAKERTQGYYMPRS